MLSGDGSKVTERDRELVAMAWDCFKTAPEVTCAIPTGAGCEMLIYCSLKVDYKKLQQLGNYKTTASANASFLAVKKKLLGSNTSGSVVIPSPVKVVRKRKAGKKAAAE
jgi:hypothetical protein